MMKTRYYWLKIKNIFNKCTKKSYFLTKYRISAQNRMRPWGGGQDMETTPFGRNVSYYIHDHFLSHVHFEIAMKCSLTKRSYTFIPW